MSLFRFGFRRVPREVVLDQREREDDQAVHYHMPSMEEGGLGRDEHDQVVAAASDFADPSPAKRKRVRGNYTVYTPKQRACIGRYALENGTERARQHFLTQFPKLNESTVRNFKKAYKDKLEHQRKQFQPKPVTEIPHKLKGRPPILLELDEKLIKFLRAIRAKGGVVNIHVVRATTAALIESNPSMSHLQSFGMPRSWVQSLYRRMGYSRRVGTTTRPPVPKGLYDESRRDYLGSIDKKIKQFNIPPSLVLNSDQTPCSYVSVGKSTMAASGTSSVPISGLTDKRNITLNFVITLSNEFLPMQVIYSGKTKASLPRGFTFPTGFCLAQNPKHWSNEQETLKLIQEVISPYVVKKRAELELAEDQKALLVWDVFRGQMTDRVKGKLDSLNVECVYVPANMTHFFQPLDLTVNGAGKKLMRKHFVTYYSQTVKQQLDSGVQLDDVEVDIRLSVIKPLHAQWLVNVYNFFTGTGKGKAIIAKGWKKAGIAGLLDGSTILPPEDPFAIVQT